MTRKLFPYQIDKKIPDSFGVVVLSGGQDSVTCLGLALRMFEHVLAVGFHYGQRHSIELDCAREICKKHNVPFTEFNIDILSQLGDSALVTTDKDVSAKHHHNDKLPASFVPNRNAFFLTAAHAVAQSVQAGYLMTGVCETDYSGYPDCREEFVKHLQMTLNNGADTDIQILTPLMYLNKAETFALAESVGFLETVLEDSHTCYNGVRDNRHEWGYGCGTCPACELRSLGYHSYKQEKESE